MFRFAATIALTAAVHATTIVVVRTPDHISVGADSLDYHLQGAPTHICKIQREQNIYFAISGAKKLNGTSASEGRSGAFVPETLARNAIQRSHSIFEAAKIFGDDSTAQFNAALKIIQDERPSELMFIGKARSPLQVIFFGMERGVPTYEIIYYMLETGPNSIRAILQPPIKCPGEKCLVFWPLGANNAIHQIDANNFGADQPEAERIRNLILLEVKAEPRFVGEPIDVVTIDAKGTHWAAPVSCYCREDIKRSRITNGSAKRHPSSTARHLSRLN